jgi:hypothetical protein
MSDPTARELLQCAYDMFAYKLEDNPIESNGGWWLRETRRVLGIPDPPHIDPAGKRTSSQPNE